MPKLMREWRLAAIKRRVSKQKQGERRRDSKRDGHRG
jgi:hypothetical protein